MKGRSSGQRRDTGKRNETGGVGFARGHGGEWREVNRGRDQRGAERESWPSGGI